MLLPIASYAGVLILTVLSTTYNNSNKHMMCVASSVASKNSDSKIKFLKSPQELDPTVFLEPDYSRIAHLSPDELSPFKYAGPPNGADGHGLEMNPRDLSGCIYFPKIALIGVQMAGMEIMQSLLTSCTTISTNTDSIISNNTITSSSSTTPTGVLSYCYKQHSHLLTNVYVPNSISRERLCKNYKEALYAGNNYYRYNSVPTCIEIAPLNAISRQASLVYKASGTKLFIILRDPIDRLVAKLNELSIGAAQLLNTTTTNTTTNSSKSRRGNKNEFKKTEITQTELNSALEKLTSSTALLNNADFEDSAQWTSIEYQILQSLYDRVFYQYNGQALHILQYDELIQCKESFFQDLINVLGEDTQYTVQCMKRKCMDHIQQQEQQKHPLEKRSSISLLTSDDLPKALQKYIVKWNSFYYNNSNNNNHVNTNSGKQQQQTKKAPFLSNPLGYLHDEPNAQLLHSIRSSSSSTTVRHSIPSSATKSTSPKAKISSLFGSINDDPLNMSSCAAFPDIVGIGAQKAGTTGFYNLLRACNLYGYKRKELHYTQQSFVSDPLSHLTLCDAYSKTFSHRPFSIEVTPIHTIARQSSEFFRHSKTKLFVILREPIDRFVSWLNMEMDFGGGNSTASSSADTEEKMARKKARVKAKLLPALAKLMSTTSNHSITSMSNTYTNTNTNTNQLQVLDNVQFEGSKDWHNMELEIVRSLYDRIFYLYHGMEIDVILFEDFVTCKADLFDKQLPHIFGDKVPKNKYKCLKDMCGKVDEHSTSSHAFQRSDVPEELRQYIIDRNKWYYENVAK